MATRRVFLHILPIFLLLFVAGFGLVLFLVFRAVDDHLETQTAVSLGDQARIFANMLPPTALESEFEARGFLIQATAGIAGRIVVINAVGLPLADSLPEGPAPIHMGSQPEVASALAGRQAVARRFSGRVGGDVVYVAMPLVSRGLVRGALLLSAPIPSAAWAGGGFLGWMGAAAAATILPLGFLTLVLARRIAKPLAALEGAVRRYAAGDLDFRVHMRAPAELKDLRDALNEMADELRDRLITMVRQRSELESILSSMVEAVIVLDTKRVVKNVNRAATFLVGRPRSELTGRTFLETFRSSELDGLVSEVLSGGAPVEKTVMLFRPERVDYVQATATPIRSGEGEPGGVLLVLNDVTRLKRLEEIRREFVANVSHELKTPITSILGFVETLKDGAVDDPGKTRRFLAIIERQTRRLHYIIEDLLSLSRLEQGGIENSRELLEVGGVVEGALEVCGPLAEEKNIRIEASVPAGLLVKLNPVLVEQALVNLLDNAVKYSDPGTTVELTARPEDRGVLVSVKDQGCGIPRKDLPRIFERFYRVDKARSRALGGTGLGLAIVKHIVLAHRGAVWAESEPGRGSTFYMRLPYEEAAHLPSTTT